MFAKGEYLKAVGQEYGWLAGVDGSGGVRCLLPYTILRKGAFRLVRFHVETIHVESGLDIEQERSFLDAVVRHFQKRKADIVIPATTNTLFRTFPNGADAAPYSSFVVGLTVPQEILWSRLSGAYRKKIHHAQRSGVEILRDENQLGVAYDLVRNTLARSGMPFMSAGSFGRLMEGLAGQVAVFVARRDHRIEGCTVFPFSQHSAYSLYGGRLPDADSGTMNLLNWEAMAHFKRSGIRRFDFMGARVAPEPGSKQHGINTFKERFGGELKYGYMWKYPLRLIGSAVYSGAVRLLRGGDIVDQERHKLKTHSLPVQAPGSEAPSA